MGLPGPVKEWAYAGGLIALGCLGYTLGVIHARWEARYERRASRRRER